jgi:hypothetical protein
VLLPCPADHRQPRREVKRIDETWLAGEEERPDLGPAAPKLPIALTPVKTRGPCRSEDPDNEAVFEVATCRGAPAAAVAVLPQGRPVPGSAQLKPSPITTGDLVLMRKLALHLYKTDDAVERRSETWSDEHNGHHGTTTALEVFDRAAPLPPGLRDSHIVAL